MVSRAVDVVLERVTTEHVRVVDLPDEEVSIGGEGGANSPARLTKILQRLTKEKRPMNMYLWMGKR